MTKPRLALLIGIICISIFPVLVKLNFTPGLISAFYRMAIAAALLLPFVLLTGRLHIPPTPILLLAVLSGIFFASDVAVWNIAIQQSTATQASLLTNLAPVWVGVGSYLFLENKPARNFWIGTVIALLGMVLLVGHEFFLELRFDLAFMFGVLSGIFYAVYILLSKHVLERMSVLSFMTINLLSSSIFLGIVSYLLNEPFSGFSEMGWLVLLVQGILCQLVAWLLLSYATQHMRATRVSLSLLSQALLASFLAWLFLDEQITLRMVAGGLILLSGIGVTFYAGDISLRRILGRYRQV
ncbi:DMT family transporter [Pontibacter sp. HSC-36F09]|uniref:DMT family transporter n=1 Tax=Pontibacter sp. HSC-36F09 TaxID=2910966 RepID=UPI00209EB8B0|nr:DMT family transporter [Pontibacter sp. HSC-36F09]MCP2045483.1 drug/metabolite transporter (DMT)-like permease [Pontibacter sp. HSC-36F09]